MKKKRTAVVGAGWFGRAHIRNFHELSSSLMAKDLLISKLKKLYPDADKRFDILSRSSFQVLD